MTNDPRAGRVAAHAGVLLAGGTVLGLVDATMIRFHLLGASGAWRYVPPRLWFVAPLCWIVVLLLAAIPCLLVSRRYGSVLAVAAGIWFLAAENASTTTPRTFLAVAIVTPLALAVALRAARGVLSWRWRRATVALAVLSGLLAAGALALTGRFDVRPGPASAIARAPNILVIFLDTVRYDAIFARDGSVHPHLQTFRRLAARSVVYDRAYAASGWTLPSHLAALTGIDAASAILPWLRSRRSCGRRWCG